MKHMLAWISVLTSLALLPAQDLKASTPAEDAILKLEQQWQDALTGSDTTALEKLYDDTLIYTHSSGKVDSKSSFIAAIKSGAIKYESMKREDIKVVVYGDHTALVTCHWDAHISAQGNKVDMNARYLHVYVHQNEGWKLVAHQSLRLP